MSWADGFFKGVEDTFNQIGKGLDDAFNALPDAIAEGLNVRKREKEYTGVVTLVVDLPGKTRLAFCHTSPPRNQMKWEDGKPWKDLEGGGKVVFDPGPSGDFDYCLIAYHFDDEEEKHAHLVRGGTYRLFKSEHAGASFLARGHTDEETARRRLKVECEYRPERVKTNLLADIPGISFGLAASGWLFVYQLGVAECLQNNGICKNPYAKAAGASGGALTSMLMLYGADLPKTRDYIIEQARLTHNDPAQVANLRAFVLGAMKEIIKDGSFMHPALQSHRLEICFSETAEKKGMVWSSITGAAKQRKMTEFNDSAEAAIALLASSTMGISGLPFMWTDPVTGEKVKVADGACTEFLPEVDELSIKCMAFSDFMGFSGGKKAEIMPTEFVPSNYGVYPPPLWTFDHLYELGYQDMSAWLEKHLEERIQEIKKAGKGDPPQKLPQVPEWKCPDEGMKWLDKLLDVVPVEWKDQLHSKPEHVAPATITKEGYLEVEVEVIPGQTPGPKDSNSNVTVVKGEKRWFSVVGHELRWRPEENTDNLKMLHTLSSHCDNPLAASRGEMCLAWAVRLEKDTADPQVIHLEHCQSVNVKLRAASKEEASIWFDCIKVAQDTLKTSMSKNFSEDAVTTGEVQLQDKAANEQTKAKNGQKKCCSMM